MQIVGITGGIGSGKSTIAQALRQRGFSVYDCDEEAKRIIVEDEAVRKAIVGLLGEKAYVDGKYNTAYVAQRVFEDAGLRKQLNAIARTINRNYDVRARMRAQVIPEGDMKICNDGKESIEALVEKITHWM